MSEQETAQTLVQITPRSASRRLEEERIAAYHELRDRMASQPAGTYWRSLDELAATPEFRRYIDNEFPEQAAEFNDPRGRRNFLKLMGASLALAGVSAGCSYQPPEGYVPYVRQPDNFIPGKPLFFATAHPQGGMGLLVQSNAGRPTKIEGNPLHPASLGHTDIFAQASLLELYDPDRSKIILENGTPATWGRFQGALQNVLQQQRAQGGAGVRILTGAVHSPTLARQLRSLRAELPQARWIAYEPAGRDNARQGAIRAFGRSLNTVYRFDRAARVLSIDSDFLSAHGGANLRYSHDFIRTRTPNGDRPDLANPLGGDLARLYAIECERTQTGAKADHRIGLKPSQVEGVVRAIGAALGVPGLTGGNDAGQGNWVAALARDLQSYRGRSIVIAGDAMSPAVHAMSHAINAALGNVGATLYYTAPVDFYPDGAGDEISELRNLIGEMYAGKVQALFILGANPVFTAPADLNFADAIYKVPFRVHHGLHVDETADRCEWHIPQLHYLESWSDVRAFDGTTSIIQPLINPLYQGRSPHELLGLMSASPQTEPYEIVRATYTAGARGENSRGEGRGAGTAVVSGAVVSGEGRVASGEAQQNQGLGAGTTGASGEGRGAREAFEQQWQRILHDGIVPDSALPPILAQVTASFDASAPQASQDGGFEIIFRPDPTVFDGRYANNAWLQELPKPLTTLTWENAAILSPQTAVRLGLQWHDLFKGGGTEVDVVRLSFQGREVEAPVYVLPGQPDNAVTLHFGYGRWRAGGVGQDIGVNTYRLRSSDAMWSGEGLRITTTGQRAQLASTQVHFVTEGRDPVRIATLDEYRAHSEEAFRKEEDTPPEDLTLYPEYRYDYHKWGMAIDNNACIGCNACVIACQAENNVPVVGKEQVLRSREMHWLRIDTYFQGERDQINDPEGPYFQPLMCVHCEKAPCEPVCPVHATVHDAEGLNVMVYNRCIGTRYCSNNCPYKVRRFNFLLYQDWDTEQYKMMRNPEVTVRSRGVMEKCTYCTQRIQAAKITASKEGRRVRDGEIVTACQAACPTEAIVFGDLNDKEARVTKIRESTKRDYPLLGELNTRPRTWHLGEVRNPNPEIDSLAHRQRKAPNTPIETGNVGGGNG